MKPFDDSESDACDVDVYQSRFRPMRYAGLLLIFIAGLFKLSMILELLPAHEWPSGVALMGIGMVVVGLAADYYEFRVLRKAAIAAAIKREKANRG